MKETRIRSIVKAISWRFIATLTTIIIVFIFTGNIILSVGIGFFELLSKLILYYLHERVWNIINWGKNSNVKNIRINQL